MLPSRRAWLRGPLAALLASALCTLPGCDNVGDNVAFVRGEVRVSGVGQFAHLVTIGNRADVTDLDGAFSAIEIPVGPQEIEIFSPIDGVSCLTVTIEAVEPLTVVNFNLVRSNGQISGSVDTATNGTGASVAIAPFAPPADCF